MNKQIDQARMKVEPPGDGHQFEKFMHHIAHDVRASVRALVDIPSWIKDDLEHTDVKLPTDVSKSLDLLVRQSKRLDQIMEDLVAYYRVGRNKDIAEADPLEVLSSCVDLGQLSKDWQIHIDVEPSLVRIGKRDLHTMFDALISNAIKHSGAQSGVLNIRSKSDESTFSIFFEDDGPGIAPQFHTRIFDVMTTLQSRDKVEGSGLGLAICQKICDLNGGHIWIESRPPKRGSIFGVELPLAR